MPVVADQVSGARTPVVGTTTEDDRADSTAVLVRESFPVVLTVAPLRERRDEIAALCRDLLAGLAEDDDGAVALSPQALAALVAADWPGNVRQLLQALVTARIRATGSRIELSDLPARHRPGGGHPLGEIQQSERQVLVVALREAGGDRTAVAQRLGISRATLYRKLRRYQLR
jgi:transcriptional regulator of acetoin/glycerol metabolism